MVICGGKVIKPECENQQGAGHTCCVTKMGGLFVSEDGVVTTGPVNGGRSGYQIPDKWKGRGRMGENWDRMTLTGPRETEIDTPLTRVFVEKLGIQ